MKKACHMTMAMTIVWIKQHQFKGGTMQTVKASEFKAKCLHFMDEVNETGEGIVITKNGKPVSILKPYRTVPSTLFGLHKGTVESKDDLIASLDLSWDAE
jgi:prevent-host-death family protein